MVKIKEETECYICKKEFSNPKYILQESTMIGLFPYRFCSKICLVKHIFKKFRSTIKKLGLGW